MASNNNKRYNLRGKVQATAKEYYITNYQRPLHAWKYEDWINLCDIEEDDNVPLQLSRIQNRPQILTTEQTQHSPPGSIDNDMIRTPNLDYVLRFNIQQLKHQTESSHGLL